MLRYLADVVTLELDEARCNGCGTCVTACPRGVLGIEDHTARILDRDACIECGACAVNCPAGALSVNSGVGCARAVMLGTLRGTGPTCECEGKSPCCG
jgi:NAD-dependent dihydropyrimidine dehydrogenase PreA subunit